VHVAGNIVKALLAVAMVAAVVLVGAFIFLSADFNLGGSSSSGGGEQVIFTVNANENVQTVADNLQKEGVIDSAFWFRLRLKMRNADSEIKAGRFELTKKMNTDRLIDALTTSPKDIGVRFTVIEGSRIGEMADKLSAAGLVDKAAFLQKAGTAEGAAPFSDAFLAASGRPQDQGLEGYLFPDTYEIKQAEGDNSDTVIKTMLSTLEAKFTPEMLKAASDRGVTVHQVLTIAAIIQREGKVKDELPTISSVFWNRLAQGMRLDADPTTQYALGKEGDWWPQLNLAPAEVDHPYNTYKIAGMPPGPICSPGLDAISAAIYPAQTEYLFFVAKNDGTGAHAFARTLEEHERNRVLYGNR
jgi:UPF0755 protein